MKMEKRIENHEAVCFLDGRGNILRANEKFENLMEASTGGLINENLSDFVPGIHVSLFKRALENAYVQEKNQRVSTKAVTETGETIEVQWELVGAVQGVFCYAKKVKNISLDDLNMDQVKQEVTKSNAPGSIFLY